LIVADTGHKSLHVVLLDVEIDLHVVLLLEVLKFLLIIVVDVDVHLFRLVQESVLFGLIDFVGLVDEFKFIFLGVHFVFDFQLLFEQLVVVFG